MPAFLAALPSRGSVQHGTGLCKPCAWFWKLQGCKNGADCLHCHLCPETEVKDRKRRKAPKGSRLQPPPGLESPSLSGSQSGSQSDTDCEMQRRVEPSLGALLHSSGQCKPCMWQLVSRCKAMQGMQGAGALPKLSSHKTWQLLRP